MSALLESGSPKEGFYCEACNFIQFLSYTEWQIHHLHHLRQPLVRLVKLNRKLSGKLLSGKSYRINTGVARSSQHRHALPPLKISLVKQGGNHFSVKREDSSASNSPKVEDRALDFEPKVCGNDSKIHTLAEELSEVEGKDLLERLGASFSISRKGKTSPPRATKTFDSGATTPNSCGPALDLKKDNILERLSGIGGISISAVSKSHNSDVKSSSGVLISPKVKPVELSQLKTAKEPENEKTFDKNKLLEKLSGSGSISIASKTGAREEGKTESKIKGEREESPKPDSFERLGPPSLKSNKSEDSNDSSDSKISGESRTSLVNAGEENGKITNETGGIEQKKFVRVKQSSFKKHSRPERQNSREEVAEEKVAAGNEDGKDRGKVTGETGIDILERLTENLNNTVGAEKSAETNNLPNSNSVPVGDPLAISTNHEEPNIDANANESVGPEETSDSRFQAGGEKNPQEQDQVQNLLLTPPSSSGQDGENSNYSTISQNQPEPYGEPDNISDGNNEANENVVSFSSLTNDDQSDEQGEQQTAFWSDLQNSGSTVDQPSEDPLLTPENPVTNGDTNFLNNFSNDYQSPPGGLPPENSEFMSLDRLGQTQHQQSSYGAEPSSPMEHLNQQVQRIPNPTPQINVISQHQLQAPPPPPQLHSGVPLPQQANSYDALHMQPPMPPPLYQGYMYNQSYPPMQRGSQPQMPMLQQRPHRNYQPIPVPQQRPRPRPAVKRSPVRPPQDMVSGVKQPRMNPPLQVRPQITNPPTKLPSGITITPPKKTLEANKVANVLASRGITVTPSRQPNHSVRPQQQQRVQAPGSSSSVLNISSAVSITSSNQNRSSSGGFAVPSPRRSTPIVNHSAERPERCMTVDLTQDDDVPHAHARNRHGGGRFSCQLCGKVFSSPPALAAHKIHHRNALSFKCDLCSAEYNNMAHLANHRQTCHKKGPSPDLAIPIVDLNHPGARDQLRKCGVQNFIPLAQLQSNSNGYFGVPIIQLDTAKEKAVSNLSLLGAGNILVLGKMKAIASQSNH